jgi:hypothetical protein
MTWNYSDHGEGNFISGGFERMRRAQNSWLGRKDSGDIGRIGLLREAKPAIRVGGDHENVSRSKV